MGYRPSRNLRYESKLGTKLGDRERCARLESDCGVGVARFESRRSDPTRPQHEEASFDGTW